MPAPLDNIYVLIAVIIGLVILAFALLQSRKAKQQLDATRAKKAARLRATKASANAELHGSQSPNNSKE